MMRRVLLRFAVGVVTALFLLGVRIMAVSMAVMLVHAFVQYLGLLKGVAVTGDGGKNEGGAEQDRGGFHEKKGGFILSPGGRGANGFSEGLRPK